MNKTYRYIHKNTFKHFKWKVCVCNFLKYFFFAKETTFSNYSDIYQSIYYPLNPNEWTVMWWDFRWWEYLHVDPFVWQLTSGCFTRYICFCKKAELQEFVYFERKKYTKNEKVWEIKYKMSLVSGESGETWKI